MNHRPLLLLGASTAVVLGLLWVVLTRDQSLVLLERGTYWVLLLHLGVFTMSLVRLAKHTPIDLLGWLRRSRWPLGGILALGFVLLAQQPFGFRSFDEVRTSAASLSMHLDQLAGVASKGVDSGITFNVTAREVGTFPMLQSFLVALLHSLTGHRPENAMILNSILLFVFLGLAWDLGCRIGGKWSGALTVALLASIPLISRSSTGGGRGLLALVLLLASMCLVVRVLEPGGRIFKWAAWICGALLLQALEPAPGTFLAMGMLAYIAWRRDPRPLSDSIALLPVLFLPILLRIRATDLNSFDSEQFAGNVLRMFSGLLDTSRLSTQSVVVSLAGLLAAPFFAIRAKRCLRDPATASPIDLVLIIFASGMLLDTLIALAGTTAVVGGRLTTPFGLWLGLGLTVVTASAASTLNPQGWAWRGLAGVLFVGFFLASLPAMPRKTYTLDAHETPELAWKRDFIARNSLGDSFVLDRDPVFWTVHKVSAASIRDVADKKDLMHSILNSRQFMRVLIYQRLEVDPRTAERVIPPGESIGDHYWLEPLSETRITPLTTLRISRVLPLGDRKPNTSMPVRDPLGGLDSRQREVAMDDFLRRYLSRLP